MNGKFFVTRLEVFIFGVGFEPTTVLSSGSVYNIFWINCSYSVPTIDFLLLPIHPIILDMELIYFRYSTSTNQNGSFFVFVIIIARTTAKTLNTLLDT